MENYDEIIAAQSESQADAPFDKDKWVAGKKAEREKLYAMTDEKADKVLTNPGVLAEYCAMQSRLGRMSVANTLLVAAQNPDATLVADFEDWHERGRSVKRGEKGMLVFEADREYTRADGSIGMSYKTKRVFDVSQTHGKPIRKRSKPTINALLSALMTGTHVPIRLSGKVSREDGAVYSQADNAVHVAKGLEGDVLFTAVARELAKSKQMMRGEYDNAFVAACASVIVCKRYGLEFKGNTRIPIGMTVMDPQEKREVLGHIREVANEIVERVDRNLYREREIERGEVER